MIPISIKYVESIIAKHSAKIKKFSQQLETDMDELLKVAGLEPEDKAYINLIKKKADILITATPDELNSLLADFESEIPATTMEKDDKKEFRKKLITSMAYSTRRNSFYPRYFKDLGLKTCVYCNSQLTVSVDSTKKKWKKITARFQVDHYLPKSHYPCFCISLFNLYPVCASCNNLKGVKKLKFKLYNNVITLPSDYTFVLDNASKAKYLLTRKTEDIEIEFKEPQATEEFKTFDDTFSIKGIYNTQKDVAGELILKKEAYDKLYKERLMKDFKEIFTDLNITNRLLIGNYVEERDIHKRPMAKFTQDIAKQLGLI